MTGSNVRLAVHGWRRSMLYRPLSVLLIATLIPLPVQATVENGLGALAGTTTSSCNNNLQQPLNVFSAAVDRQFEAAAQSHDLRPVGAVAIALEPGVTVTSQVAVANGGDGGHIYARRDVIRERGLEVAADSNVGLDRSRGVLWAKVKLALPDDLSIEYLAEFDAQHFPSLSALPADPSARQLLVSELVAAGALMEKATVSHAGVPLTINEGDGSLDRAFASLTTSVEKSSRRTRCRNDCTRRYLSLAPGAFEVACLLSVAVGCIVACAFTSVPTLGSACVGCLSWGLAVAGPACGGFDQVVSIFRWYRCWRRC